MLTSLSGQLKASQQRAVLRHSEQKTSKSPQTFFISITFLHTLWISVPHQRTPDTCAM